MFVRSLVRGLGAGAGRGLRAAAEDPTQERPCHREAGRDGHAEQPGVLPQQLDAAQHRQQNQGRQYADGGDDAGRGIVRGHGLAYQAPGRREAQAYPVGDEERQRLVRVERLDRVRGVLGGDQSADDHGWEHPEWPDDARRAAKAESASAAAFIAGADVWQSLPHGRHAPGYSTRTASPTRMTPPLTMSARRPPRWTSPCLTFSSVRPARWLQGSHRRRPRSTTSPTLNSRPTRWFSATPRVTMFRRACPGSIFI